MSADRCYVLYVLLRQALNSDGDVFECGVYRGGTACLFAEILRRRGSSKKLFLFDTFDGMPEADPAKDIHMRGDFADTSKEKLEKELRSIGMLKRCEIRKGLIPDTFRGLESNAIAFAHVDVDLYASVWDSLAFIWPKISIGGFLVIDDYGFPTCPGAKSATDDFFADKPSVPLCLPTGQAIVFKGVS